MLLYYLSYREALPYTHFLTSLSAIRAENLSVLTPKPPVLRTVLAHQIVVFSVCKCGCMNAWSLVDSLSNQGWARLLFPKALKNSQITWPPPPPPPPGPRDRRCPIPDTPLWAILPRSQTKDSSCRGKGGDRKQQGITQISAKEMSESRTAFTSKSSSCGFCVFFLSSNH